MGGGGWGGGGKPVTTTLTYCNIREKRLGCCRSSPSGPTAGRKRGTGKTKPRQRRREFSFFPRLFKSRTFSLEPRDKEPRRNSFSVKCQTQIKLLQRLRDVKTRTFQERRAEEEARGLGAPGGGGGNCWSLCFRRLQPLQTRGFLMALT